MAGRSFIVKLLLFSGFLLVFTGCSHLQNIHKILKKRPGEVRLQDIRPGDYPEEISRQLDIAENHPVEDARINAQLQLTRLYSSRNNPNRSIKKAIDSLEQYIASVPVEGIQFEAEDWLAMLKDVERLSRKTKMLNSKVKKIELEKKTLGDVVEKLKQDNQDLNDKIGKLKALEIMHEEKKKMYK